MASGHFDDRVVTLEGTPDQLAGLATVLGSRTRLAVLAALMHSKEPLHINEVARRVGVDASPVRTHLELLAKANIIEEITGDIGRERRFRTRLSDVRVTLEGVERLKAPAQEGKPNRQAQRLLKRIAAIEAEVKRLETQARKTKVELAKAWGSD